ncbi:3-ketoacyl-CoA thiolase [Dactylonectria macrodidyma]|uniref:3-ketoacyl-CoA thiolase n=1 Tax=Dactylonectria macrodidyma TaxID=307937 RepID=A0A9P9ET75_9HYPO|nr:3-ketoacyl-CoA thiolase [Dactylonectria macrodidyma]
MLSPHRGGQLYRSHMSRLKFEASSTLLSVWEKCPTDAVFLSAVRSPITRTSNDGFKDTWPENTLRHARICQDGKNDTLDCGQCSSSLQAITNRAHSISARQLDVALVGHVGITMRNYRSRSRPTDVPPSLRESRVKQAADCLVAMGDTPEHNARRHSVSREDQYGFIFLSHLTAKKAQYEGSFTSEIVTVTYRAPSGTDSGGKTYTFMAHRPLHRHASIRP